MPRSCWSTWPEPRYTSPRRTLLRAGNDRARRARFILRAHTPQHPAAPATTRTHAMNAIQLLKEDHKKVRGMLAELEATTPRGIKTRTGLLAKIAREIEVHT